MEFLISKVNDAWTLSFKKAEDIEGAIWRTESFGCVDQMLAFLRLQLEPM